MKHLLQQNVFSKEVSFLLCMTCFLFSVSSSQSAPGGGADEGTTGSSAGK